MDIVWLPQAIQDLQTIFDYISADSTAMAEIVSKKIVLHAERLKQSPGLGRPGRVHVTRELILVDIPYIMPYIVEGSSVQILGVFHQSRMWPDNF